MRTTTHADRSTTHADRSTTHPSRSTSHPARSTAAATTPRSSARRLRTVLAVALALGALTAGPASAQIDDLAPGGNGPDDEEEPPILVPIPLDDPSVTLDLTPVCNPVAGVEYVIHHHDAPAAPSYSEADWGPDEQIFIAVTVDGPSGSIETGEGDFVVRGRAGNEAGPFPHLFWQASTDFQQVTVECLDEDPNPGPDPDPDSDPEGEPEDDDIVPGNPNFTG